MQVLHHYHHNMHHYLKDDISKLEIAVWFHTVGRALIAIFIPIILLRLGFSLQNVILFYVMYHFSDFLMNFVARESVYKFGAKNTVLFSIIAELVYFIILYFAQIKFYTLIVLAILGAAYNAFYWVGHWFLFNEFVSTKKSANKDVGGLKIARMVASLIAPGIGALFLIFFTKNHLIILASFFFFLSMLPLSRMNTKFMKPAKREAFINFFKSKENRSSFLSMVLYGIHIQSDIIVLPVFIYLTFSSITSVAAVPIITAIVAILIIFYMRRLGEKSSNISLIFYGSILMSIGWLIRFKFPNVSMIYLTTFLLGIFSVLVQVPIDSRLVKYNKNHNMLNTAMIRNIGYNFPSMFLYMALYIIVEYFHLSFVFAAVSMFVLAIISSIILLGRQGKIKGIDFLN